VVFVPFDVVTMASFRIAKEVSSLHHRKHIASSLEAPFIGSCFGRKYLFSMWESNNTEVLCVAKCRIFSVATGVAYCNHCVLTASYQLLVLYGSFVITLLNQHHIARSLGN
jgi:hypothetical protein